MDNSAMTKAEKARQRAAFVACVRDQETRYQRIYTSLEAERQRVLQQLGALARDAEQVSAWLTDLATARQSGKTKVMKRTLKPFERIDYFNYLAETVDPFGHIITPEVNAKPAEPESQAEAIAESLQSLEMLRYLLDGDPNIALQRTSDTIGRIIRRLEKATGVAFYPYS